MLNKRLFIKNLLAYNDENTFYDKKVSIDLVSNTGKSKFLKHICALSNSNPDNNSFLVIGIEDKTNKIKGIDFIDDSIIQNLVSAYLTNPPIIKYENIYFPNLPKEKVIGLLTIRQITKHTCFKKTIGKIASGTYYYRKGSNSLPINNDFSVDSNNKEIVSEIEKMSNISVKVLLDDIFGFYEMWGGSYNPQYVVFKEQYVVCWAGYKTDFDKKPILSEVDIRIINEGVRIFYSAIQWVDVTITDSEFIVTEYVSLGFDNNYKLYPFEKMTINFVDNGQYDMKTELIFEPPKFDKNEIKKLYERAKETEDKFKKGLSLQSDEDYSFGEGLANYFLICYFNGVKEARNDLINSINYLDGAAAEFRLDCMRILKKVENKNGS